MAHQRLLDLIFKATPKDYRGVGVDGRRGILILRFGATVAVALEDLTPAEVEARRPGVIEIHGTAPFVRRLTI